MTESSAPPETERAAPPPWTPHPDGPSVIGPYLELQAGRWVRAEAVLSVHVPTKGGERAFDAPVSYVTVAGEGDDVGAGMLRCPYAARQVLGTLEPLWLAGLPRPANSHRG